jgi:hypothetical protein
MFTALAEAILGVFVALVAAMLLFVAGLGLLVPFVLFMLVVWLIGAGHAARLR